MFAGQERPDLRQTLTPAFIAGFGQPLLFVELPDRDVQAGALLAQQNGPRQIWATQDGITLTLLGGFLTETRGLGGDLMSTDLGDIAPDFGGQTDSSVRIHRYLTGDDRLVAMAFVCNYARVPGVSATTVAGQFDTLRVSETCSGPEIGFENLYWINGAGVTVKSVQWIGPNVGYAHIELARGQ